MKSAILAAVVILVSGVAMGQTKTEPASLIAARKSYEAEVAKATATHDADFKLLATAYSTRLMQLQDELTKAGELDAAIMVRAEAERLVVAKKPTPGKSPSLDGEWVVLYSNDTQRHYSITGATISYTASTGDKVRGTLVNGFADFGSDRPEFWASMTTGEACVRVFKGRGNAAPIGTIGIAKRK